MRELKIIECDEGYVLTHEVQVTDTLRETQYIPIQERTDEQECMVRLLLAVAEHFGFGYDTFRPDNLNIKCNKKGHKYVRPQESTQD